MINKILLASELLANLEIHCYLVPSVTVLIFRPFSVGFSPVLATFSQQIRRVINVLCKNNVTMLKVVVIQTHVLML